MVISAWYSALRGGAMFADGLFNLMIEEGWISMLPDVFVGQKDENGSRQPPTHPTPQLAPPTVLRISDCTHMCWTELVRCNGGVSTTQLRGGTGRKRSSGRSVNGRS